MKYACRVVTHGNEGNGGSSEPPGLYQPIRE